MKIYISGSIRNNPNYREQFKTAENILAAKGYTVINPAWKPEGLTYIEYIDMGLAELSKCDAIYMLENWTESQGARCEYVYALTAKLKSYDERYIKPEML